MRINISGIDSVTSMIDNFAEGLGKRLERGLAQGGAIVEGEAKALCPVSTEKTRPGGPHGELRQSITSHTEGMHCEIGTNKEYAMYVEFGTCKMAAQPYLVPALETKADEVVQIIKEAVNEKF